MERRAARAPSRAARRGRCSCCLRCCWPLSSGCRAARPGPVPCSSADGSREAPMFRETRVHVVVPAYNVAAHIGAVVRGLPDFVDTVTVVDDGSTDGTAEAARAARDRRVTVLQSPVNEGVGGATTRGLKHALGPWTRTLFKIATHGLTDPPHLL